MAHSQTVILKILRANKEYYTFNLLANCNNYGNSQVSIVSLCRDPLSQGAYRLETISARSEVEVWSVLFRCFFILGAVTRKLDPRF